MRPFANLSSLALASALLVMLVGPAASGVPSPPQCTLPACGVQLCPYGDMVTTIVVRDVNSSPVVGATVVIDFCECPDVKLCPGPGSQYVIAGDCQVFGVTDATGTVEFPILGGGLCVGAVRISADGVVLTSNYFAISPDQDASLAVDGVDLAIFNTKFGGGNPTADFDCDGLVAASDRAVMMQHMGHTCDGIVPTLPRTWGRLKGVYR